MSKKNIQNQLKLSIQIYTNKVFKFSNLNLDKKIIKND